MAVRQATVYSAKGAFFVWCVDDIVWLRSKCRVAVTPVGACSTKLATKGKAAAVPVLLSDEDLFTAVSNHWVRILDGDGTVLDSATALQRSLGPDSDGRQWLRRLVHRDLTAKGYALTNGLKFGVDFLAYKGDPTAVHAAFMVIVCRAGTGISPLDLVARSRVATTALKIAVLAWADTCTEKLTYAAFKRMGPGSAIFADTAAQQAGMLASAAVQHTMSGAGVPISGQASEGIDWMQLDMPVESIAYGSEIATATAIMLHAAAEGNNTIEGQEHA